MSQPECRNECKRVFGPHSELVIIHSREEFHEMVKMAGGPTFKFWTSMWASSKSLGTRGRYAKNLLVFSVAAPRIQDRLSNVMRKIFASGGDRSGREPIYVHNGMYVRAVRSDKPENIQCACTLGMYMYGEGSSNIVDGLLILTHLQETKITFSMKTTPSF